MRDLVLTVSVIAAFALLITAHVTIAFGLARRAPRWRAPLALVIPPLAPYWALGARMWVRAALWLASVAIYGVGRWLGAALAGSRAGGPSFAQHRVAPVCPQAFRSI